MTESKTGAVRRVRIGWLAVGIAGLISSAGYLIAALGMPQGTEDRPGPGVFPSVIGVAGILFALIVIAEAFLLRDDGEPVSWPRGEALKKMLIFFAGSTVFILLLPVFGQYIAASAYLVGVLMWLGRLRWWKALIIGTAIGVGLTFVFTEVLGVRLPEGLWGF